ncbi:eukaryotic aspartyl protease family protein [Striga asiatica]|uniref:Eukaryotic aspartyl protease family protein n=1 Tax=Striga asiatica TaxID=4170 RepID=A0A5A7PLM5_STRAF|nr:eukaryotic aspartyl protease family protein [Striga asiatica]
MAFTTSHLLLTLLLPHLISTIFPSSNAFSLNLIHRDNPNSPLYQPNNNNLSHLQRFSRDAKATKTRVSELNSPRFPLLFCAPLYTLDARIGSPPTKTTLVFDTAAPLTWTQCKPNCAACFRQSHPVFDRTKSASYKRLHRNHTLAGYFNCTVVECYYFVSGRGGSGLSSSGLVSTETFHIPSLPGPVERHLANVVFGCGTYNTAPAGLPSALTGVLGMGNVPTSLARQLGSGPGPRFSYCLSRSRTKGSVLSFGENAAIGEDKNVQTTSFLKSPWAWKSLLGSGYRLGLTGISVAGKRLEIPRDSFKGGCIIDTGSPFSVLEERAYRALVRAVSGYFEQFKNVKKVVTRMYPKNLCYNYPRGFGKFPSVVWHFEGADLEVNGTSLFSFGSNFLMSNFVCLQLFGAPETNVLGTYQQQNGISDVYIPSQQIHKTLTMATPFPSFLLILLPLSLLHHSLSLDSRSAAGFSLKLTRHKITTLSENSTPANYFPNTIRPRITRSNSIFTIEATIGTPPSKKSFIFDPGCELTWTQCTPCIKCFKQDYPLFDPKQSKSFQTLPQNHPSAKYFRRSENGSSFIFHLLYASGESARGKVSIETFGFPSHKKRAIERVKNVVFGCADNQIGRFRSSVTGIMGMSRSPLSMFSQMGPLVKRFSYCLPHIRKRLNLLVGTFSGGCMLDAGCGESVIEIRAYNEIRRFLMLYFEKYKLTRITGVSSGFLADSFCYRLPRGFRSYPNMTFHFQDADLDVGPTNLFHVEGDRFCLAMIGMHNMTILGAYQQQNVRFVYDVGYQKLFFGKEDCSLDRA